MKKICRKLSSVLVTVGLLLAPPLWADELSTAIAKDYDRHLRISAFAGWSRAVA